MRSFTRKLELVSNIPRAILAMRSLENDRNAIIKPADKGPPIAARDRPDHLTEAGKQLSDSNTYKEVKFSEKDLII